MSHTPGPWKASEFMEGAGLEIVADGRCIARAYPVLQRDANARLIAAAPELLAALKAVVLAEFGSLDHPQIKDAPMWSKAIAAIAKAEER